MERTLDRERVRLLAEQAALDLNYLLTALKRHGLEAKWNLWKPKA